MMEEGKKRNGKWKESNYVLGQPLAHAQSGADTREQNEIAEKSWTGLALPVFVPPLQAMMPDILLEEKICHGL